MRRLMRMNDDEGAVAIMVALLMIVLLGSAAIVIDVGALHLERRELQNGADASALALAQACAGKEAGCASQTDAQAYGQTHFTNPNARDGSADLICVMDGHAAVPAGLQWEDADSMSCPWLSSNSLRTLVRSRNGADSAVRHFLAPILTDDGSNDATSVGATARVAWGSPGSGKTLPLTLCEDEFNNVTANGTVFSVPLTLRFPKGGSGPDVCPGYPGGFGWLSTTDSCYPATSLGWVPGDVGADFPNSASCPNSTLQAILQHAIAAGETVLIPIFDTFEKGPPPRFHIVGYGAFKLQAYEFPGRKHPVPPPVGFVCAGSDNCIYGSFEEKLSIDQVVDESDLSGPDYGATIIILTN